MAPRARVAWPVSTLLLLAGLAGAQEPADPTSIASLRRALLAPHADDRGEAARRLSDLGVAAEPAVGDLVSRLDDDDDEVGGLAAWALWRIGPPGRSALTGAALHGSARGGARAIRQLVQGSFAALPPIREALRDEREGVRGEALDALVGMAVSSHLVLRHGELQAIVEAMLLALDDPAPRLRASAVEGLHHLLVSGSLPTDVVTSALDPIASRLDDGDAGVREAAGRALRDLGYRLRVSGAPAPAWVLGAAYWRRGLLLLLVLAAWFGLAARYPRRRPARRVTRASWVVLVWVSPTALAGAATFAALSAPWVEPFLPRVELLLPLPVVGAVSACAPCLLAAAWVVLRERGGEAVA